MSNTRITLIFKVFKVMGLWGGGGEVACTMKAQRQTRSCIPLLVNISHLTVTTRKYDFAKQRA